VAGPDFGTGSSREHAPWALADWGFRAVIAPSFGDIFRSNCYKVGLLPVELSEADVETLLRAARDDPAAVVTIDLEAQTVEAPGVSTPFDVDPFSKLMLLEGHDEIDLTLAHAEAIARYEAARPSFLPTT
jgi:3-isopropylmalate/(R)-2-methylmalate dehydratase small subunit